MKIVGYLFVGLIYVVGPGLLLIATVTGVERALFLYSAATADGAVIAMRETPQSAGKTRKSFFPIFQFKAASGRSYTVTSNIAERPTSWQLGGAIRVLYQPDRPENAHIDTFAQLWMLQVVVGVVGAAFSTMPVLILIRRFRSAE
ncbi:MAG TPA: DUF3592 domain-containing protein [Vicinamibacterales bacterium]|nr:DUF3592 domain-containing protein [Vicinamibacterales bacterium]